MIIEKVIGNIHEMRFSGYKVDRLKIEWYHAHKKIDRKRTQAGREIGIRLEEETAHRGLLQGDVLAVIEETVIVVEIKPDRFLKVHADSCRIPKLCYEIGNRHAPLFQGESPQIFLTPYDPPLKHALEKMGFVVEEKELVPDMEKQISSVYAHSHAH